MKEKIPIYLLWITLFFLPILNSETLHCLFLQIELRNQKTLPPSFFKFFNLRLNCGQCCQNKSQIVLTESNIAEYFMSSRCEKKYAAEQRMPYATRNNFIKIFKWWSSAFNLRSLKTNRSGGGGKYPLHGSQATTHFLKTIIFEGDFSRLHEQTSWIFN